METECLMCGRRPAVREHVQGADYRYNCERCWSRFVVSVVVKTEWWYLSPEARARPAEWVSHENASGRTPYLG